VQREKKSNPPLCVRHPQLFEETTPYFVAELPSGRKLVYGISEAKFPLQFGR
jgi:hypothetical protein